MTPTSRRISENVVVLQLRLGMNNKDLGDAIGMHRVSIGNRITGKTEWKAYEVDAVARALDVTPDELMGKIPDFQEWERRRQQPAAPLRVAPGPRFFVMPEIDLDGTPPLASIGSRFSAKPPSDIMSVSTDSAPLRPAPLAC